MPDTEFAHFRLTYSGPPPSEASATSPVNLLRKAEVVLPDGTTFQILITGVSRRDNAHAPQHLSFDMISARVEEVYDG